MSRAAILRSGHGPFTVEELDVGDPNEHEVLVRVVGGRRIAGVMEGDSVPTELIPHLAELHAAGRFPFGELITTFPLDRINEAEAASADGSVIKPVLTFD
jgi:Zn-dependent alcohol dehydrogenase